MKKALAVLFIAGMALASCEQQSVDTVLIPYHTVENDLYDIPVKSQVSMSVVLDTVITDTAAAKTEVGKLMNYLFLEADQTEIKYHPEPTHIFIYVYRNSQEFRKGAGLWRGMISRVMGKDEGMRWNTDEFIDAMMNPEPWKK